MFFFYLPHMLRTFSSKVAARLPRGRGVRTGAATQRFSNGRRDRGHLIVTLEIASDSASVMENKILTNTLFAEGWPRVESIEIYR